MATNDTYDLKPSKEAYRAIKSDVTPVSAFKELIDNALDNWARVSQQTDDIWIKIEHQEEDEEQEEIVIRDNSGGVPEDDVGMLFALGESAKEEIPGSIGAYGIGAKKAIVNLGNSAVIRSRSLDSDTGFGFEIDQEWLHDDDRWEVEKEEFEDIDPGVTEIRIRDLNVDWEDYAEDIPDELGKTYQRFIQGNGLSETGEVSILVNGESVTAPTPINWSFTPVDGFAPRRYEKIELESNELDEDVYLHVTVGLMRKADQEAAGTDIYCQNRLVLSGIEDERAGYNTGSGSNRLGKHTNQHNRLKVEVEFETEGDASTLPWDAQKSDIDRYNRVAQLAYGWIRRIVIPYHEAAGAFDIMRTTFLAPYGRDSEYATTEMFDEPFDYSGRKRVTDKPDTGFTDARWLNERCSRDVRFKIYSLDGVDPKLVPAYHEEMIRLTRQEYDLPDGTDEETAVSELTDVESLAGLEEEERPVDVILTEIKQWVRFDSREDRRRTYLEAWKQPIYDHLLEQQVGDLQDLETVDREERIESTETESSERATTEESRNESEATSTTESARSGTGSALFEESDTSTELANQQSAEPTEAISSEREETSSATQTELNDISSEEIIRLPIPAEDWPDLVESLGLDEDASPEEVRERLMDMLSVIRQLPGTNR